MITILCCFVGLVDAADNPIKRMEGYYQIPAHSCFSLEGGEYVSCEDRMTDCLSIKAIDGKTAQISVDSWQTNGHECGVSGVAKLQGNSLVYVGGDDDLDSKGKKFSIDLIDGKLKFRYLNPSNIEMRSPFCGFRASLELLEFDMKVRAPVGPSCPRE